MSRFYQFFINGKQKYCCFTEGNLFDNEYFHVVITYKFCKFIRKRCLFLFCSINDNSQVFKTCKIFVPFILDLLSRLQMWTISAEIINISNLPALTELNQVGYLFCSKF